jgi:hypothetical protein
MFRPEGSPSRVQVDGGEHLPQMRQGVTPCGPSKGLKRPDQPRRALQGLRAVAAIACFRA